MTRQSVIFIVAIIMWVGSFLLLIPSPSRGLPLVTVLLVMGLPIWMLSWSIVKFLLLFSYPISILIMLAASGCVILSSSGGKRVASRVAYVDLGVLAVFLTLAIAFWS